MQTTPERSVFSHRLKSPTTVLAFYCILTKYTSARIYREIKSEMNGGPFSIKLKSWRNYYQIFYATFWMNQPKNKFDYYWKRVKDVVDNLPLWTNILKQIKWTLLCRSSNPFLPSRKGEKGFRRGSPEI